MDGKRPLNRGHSGRRESDYIPEVNTEANTPTHLPDATMMSQFNVPSVATGPLDQSYNHFFSPLSPGSTSIPPLYSSMQQSAPPPHQTASTFSWNTPMPLQFFEQPQGGPSQMNHTTQSMSQQSPGLDGMGCPLIPSEVELEVTEEKRRRNTAASARFRIKKKHKTIALERSVTDLSGRAEDLQREVTDLRRENIWLKEIVMLKGTQYAASNRTHHEALQQAANLVTSGKLRFASAPIGNLREQSEGESEDGSELDAGDNENEKGKKPAMGKKA